ncbi:hypothetical protein PVAP13_9KG077620 [Panicum virgatum]|uniref:Uncharacterized protein n=1 Tax=Panicum virgatum TaxID=38727 RepID=A0A8T0NDB5_PANVG|nr:hypothetical protein PVAP13_9KG077620 [Panicum virgatum]
MKRKSINDIPGVTQLNVRAPPRRATPGSDPPHPCSALPLLLTAHHTRSVSQQTASEQNRPLPGRPPPARKDRKRSLAVPPTPPPPPHPPARLDARPPVRRRQPGPPRSSPASSPSHSSRALLACPCRFFKCSTTILLGGPHGGVLVLATIASASADFWCAFEALTLVPPQ